VLIGLDGSFFKAKRFVCPQKAQEIMGKGRIDDQERPQKRGRVKVVKTGAFDFALVVAARTSQDLDERIRVRTELTGKSRAESRDLDPLELA